MKQIRLITLILLMMFIFTACTADIRYPILKTEDYVAADDDEIGRAPAQDINSASIFDNDDLYDQYDPLDVVCFYVTVTGGNAADHTDHTFEEVNSYLNLQGMTGVQKIKTEIILQIGDETGPLPGEIGYTALGSNATINVRGRTSTSYAQKSYRIDLFDSAGLWRGQRAIALNKHPADVTRMRNMLYYELLQDVPGITSLRTQLVHLYVRDLTAENPEGTFVDYGLYTQVELPNGRYLRNHGMSINGNLYKANQCEMYRYEDVIMLATDPDYNPEAFSAVLEPKTGEDHSKLIEMLTAVNDYTIPIEQVIEQYFNLDNLTSYLAFNLLMANSDSSAQNYYLYSPVNSDTWYYLCWDGDDSTSIYEDAVYNSNTIEGLYNQGISNYWGVVLFNRMLRVPEYRQALLDKMELLRTIITPERVQSLVEEYRAVVDPYVESMPDSMYLPQTFDARDDILDNLHNELDMAYERFLISFERPMPFFMSDVVCEDGMLTLAWDSAYDFDGEFVTYDVRIGTDWTYAGDALAHETLDTLSTCISVEALPPGEYYWQVVARNESGFEQAAFDLVSTDSGYHTGMRRFQVLEDGTVVNQ